MKKTTQLTRNCTVCGQKKPLSAFLQLGKSGAIYGSICGTCRGTQTKPAIKKEDDQTTSSTGFKIDAKSKVHEAAEKKSFVQRLKVSNEGEKKKKEQTTTQKIEKTEGIEKAEKTHREGFIESRKQSSFLGTMNKKAEMQKQAGVIQQRRDISNTVKTKITNQSEREAKNTADVNKQQQLLNSTDLSIQYIDPQGSEIKYQSATFQQFRTWLGGSAPMSRSINQMFGNKDPKAANTPATTQPAQQKDEKKKGQDPVVEYVNKNWQGSKRR